MIFFYLYKRDIKCKSTKRRPKLLSTILQLFFTKRENFPPTTRHKIMPENEISLLPSFSLKDSKKEEGEGASVVLKF